MNVPSRLALALIAAGMLPGAESSAQAPSFAVRVESVRVDVLVADGGRPILGLRPDDFELFDNDVRQHVDLVSFEQIPLNVILALDVSASLSGDRLELLLDAGRAVLDGLGKDDQAALVTFSHIVTLGAPLSRDVRAVRNALDETSGSGETSLVDGAYAAMTIGESDAGRALLIVFSDGLDTASWLKESAVLETAKRSDVVAYGAAIASRGNTSFLRELSSLTGGTLYNIESTRDLRGTFLKILDEFRHRYLVSYTPKDVSKGGWHRLEVRVKNRRATVKARPGYLAGPS